MKIDYEKLDTISITELARRLGIVQDGNNWQCPNKSGHKNGDQHGSLAIYEDTGSFTCFGCGVSGKRLDLIELALNRSTEEAYVWACEQYGIGKVITPAPDTKKKYPCRHIMTNEELTAKGLARFYHYSHADLQPRMLNDIDLYNIETILHKRYSLKAVTEAHVMISDAKRCLVFPDQKFSYNIKCTKPSNKYLIIEGRTDYLTALTMELADHFNVIARINKTQKYAIPNDADEVIYLLDPDDILIAEKADLAKKGGQKGAMYYCTSGFPRNCIIKAFGFHDTIGGTDLSIYGKDLSDFWYNSGLAPILTNIIDSIPEAPKRLYSDMINRETEFVFWDNKLKIDGYDLFKAIVNDGFKLLRDYDSPDDEFRFGRIYNNQIEWYDQNEIHQHVLLDMLPRLPEQVTPNISKLDIERAVYNSTGLFETKRFNIIPKLEFKMNYDDAENFYMYLENYFVHVTKDNVEKLPYSELKKPIFKRSVKKNVDINLLEYDDYKNCEWATFLQHTCTPARGMDIDGERYLSLQRTIGYLLLKYKSPTLSKAVIFSEDNIDDKPRGRTGKGLISGSLDYLVNAKTINGKNFDPKGQFAFQDVQDFHNVIHISDVNYNFRFNDLFSQLTDGFTMEAKHQGRRSKSPARSPKIIISTNQSIIPDDSSSFRARVHEMELYCYYDDEFTPATEVGHWFFDNWDKDEWDRFFNYNFYCVQQFLTFGLTGYQSKTLQIKKITKDCGLLGYEYLNEIIQSKLKHENEIYLSKTTFRSDLIENADLTERSLSAKKLTTIITNYCAIHDLELDTRVRLTDLGTCYKISKPGYVSPKNDNIEQRIL